VQGTQPAQLKARKSLANQLLDIFLLSLVSMLNPSLLAAVTVMLLLDNPKRLMTGYLAGAYLTSITVGLVIALSLPNSSTESTSKHTIGPGADIALGAVALAVAFVLATGRDQPMQRRRQAKKAIKYSARLEAGKPTESLPIRLLGKGDPKLTFMVGAALSFPGASYLAALNRIHKLAASTLATVLIVIAYCVIQQLLLEIPLLGYVFARDRATTVIEHFKDWMARKGRSATVIGATLVGAALILSGLTTLG
jgi:hypothetical protein